MSFKKYLQNLFKKEIQSLFFYLYGKITIYNGQEKSKITEYKVDKIILKNGDFSSDNHVFEIDEGRVYTDIVEHVAIIENNSLLPKVSFQQIDGELKNIEFNKVLKIGTPRLIKKIDGTMLSLVQGVSGENYFHFLFDLLAKLKICEQKISLDKIDYYYVPGNINWQKKIFLHFGINEGQLISSKIHRHVRAKKLIALDHAWYHKGYIQDEIENFPEWIVYWLREKFLEIGKKFECNKNIFIDRSESKFNHCKFQNNEEIINFLKSKGFTSYKVGELDFLEQVYLFSNAKTIIGPHGAAFTNIIFCKPKTNIIEILPYKRKSNKCERISNILDLNYSKILALPVTNIENRLGDMNFEIKKMKDIVDNIPD